MDHLTILYVEVDHFSSRLAAEGIWETRLTLAATLYDAGGQPVMTLPAAPATDRCRQRRRDFFMRSRLTRPASVRAGEHVLKVTVTDEQSGRIAEQSLTIQITPTGGMGDLLLK